MIDVVLAFIVISMFYFQIATHISFNASTIKFTVTFYSFFENSYRIFEISLALNIMIQIS